MASVTQVQVEAVFLRAQATSTPEDAMDALTNPDTGLTPLFNQNSGSGGGTWDGLSGIPERITDFLALGEGTIFVGSDAQLSTFPTSFFGKDLVACADAPAALFLLGAAASAHSHTIPDVAGLQVALSAKLDASAYTAADVLAKLLTVDGSTSSLDADLLDGQHGSYYAAASHNHTLNALSNVTIASITSGEILTWNGTAWVNNTLAEAGIQPAGSYLTANQTITLSGIVTGTGTTSIATSIADGALSIAKTSGLQSTLDARMATASYPDLVAIEALSGTSGLLRKTAANTWSLDTNTYLTSVPVTSVFGRTGAVVAASGDYTTSQVTEGASLYFTEARVRGTDLAGYVVGSNSALAATDTVLGAFGKIQAQINARPGTLTGSGAAGQISYWSGASSQSGDGGLVGTQTSGVTRLLTLGDGAVDGGVQFRARGTVGNFFGFSYLRPTATIQWSTTVNGDGTTWGLRNYTTANAEIDSPLEVADGANGIITIGGAGRTTRFTGSTEVYCGTAGATAFSTRVSGESSARFIINADGGISWGSGFGAVDTNLYRSAANTLRTDDSFSAFSVRSSTELVSALALSDTIGSASRWKLINSNESWGVSGYTDAGGHLRIAYLRGDSTWTDKYYFGRDGSFRLLSYSGGGVRMATIDNDGMVSPAASAAAARAIIGAPGLSVDNAFTSVNTFNGTTNIAGGGTWSSSIINNYSSGWSGKIGWGARDSIAASAIFERPTSLEALRLSLKNYSESVSIPVFTVSCNGAVPTENNSQISFGIPVVIGSGTITGSVTGRVALSSEYMKDMSLYDFTLPDAPIGTLLSCYNPSSSERRINTPSGVTIHWITGFAPTYNTWFGVPAGNMYLLQRVTSSRWVVFGSVGVP